MNNYIVGALVIAGALIAGAIFFIGGGPVAEKVVASEITLETNEYDFGDIDIFGGKVKATFPLTNTGSADVTVLSGVTSCICTEGEIDSLSFGMHGSDGETVIPAGETRELVAIYDPLAHGPDGVGKIKRQLQLKTNSSVTEYIDVSFTGNVVKNAE